ncbi:MAG: bifunctional DNA primase/polymerase [Anaerolineae bacterium]|nr:bifunctional DNA primase/polymerase [Anaerolineae bacterium]
MSEYQPANTTRSREFPQPSPTLAQHLFHLPVSDLSPVQETAMGLYQLGLNVFPVPYGKKGGYPWGMMQYTRLLAEDIYPLFRDNCNLAVMTGRTSGNLFVIDCETKAAFNAHELLLRKAGIPIWGVRSMGLREGGHFYLRCADGEIENVKPGQRKDVEIRGNRNYVLAPPSLHPRTRRLYQWHIREIAAPPVITLEQVKWLELKLVSGRCEEHVPQPFSQLATSTRDFLAAGAPEGERNNRLFIAACDLAGNDYDLHAAMQLLMPVARSCGLLEREIRDSVVSAYSKPRTSAKPTTASQKQPSAWERAVAWANNQTWKGKSGQTDRAVFLACCERAKTANEHGVYRASSREIAEIARIRHATAQLSLKRLETARFLIFAGKDGGSQAHLYRFGAETIQTKLVRNRTTIITTGLSNSGTDSHQIRLTDASEALGKTAYNLYLCMLQFPEFLRHRDLVLASGLSKTQVSNGLKKLVAYGLVRKVGRTYQVIPHTDEQLEDQVARPAGTLGKGEARRQKHQRERAAVAGARLYKARFGKAYQPSSSGFLVSRD